MPAPCSGLFLLRGLCSFAAGPDVYFLPGFLQGRGFASRFNLPSVGLSAAIQGNGALVEVTGCQGNAALRHLDGLVAEKGLAPPETDSRLTQAESTAVPQDVRHRGHH